MDYQFTLSSDMEFLFIMKSQYAALRTISMCCNSVTTITTNYNCWPIETGKVYLVYSVYSVYS
jgi:hypothetical protein